MPGSTPELPPEDDWAGDLQGAVLDERYQVEGLLGTGGMGAVYSGQQITLRKPVAIKVLRPEYAHREIYVRRFLREARAASMINHRNVVEVTDFGQAEGGRVYFVMEYLEGQDLARLIQARGRLPWRMARRILLQTVRALKAAHAKGVIHRDIKPANIFLVDDDEGGFVKVLDFGIAKVADPLENSAEGLTSSNQMIGTAMYMAPEQALGRGVDARSDVYSFGAVAFQLLTGHVPFEGATAFEVLMKRVNEPPPALRPFAPELTAEVEDLVRRSMARDPVARFQDMAEVESALLEIPADACADPENYDATGPATPPPSYASRPEALGSDPEATEAATSASARNLASTPAGDTVMYGTDEAPVAPSPSTGSGRVNAAALASVQDLRPAASPSTDPELDDATSGRGGVVGVLVAGLVLALGVGTFFVWKGLDTTPDTTVAKRSDAPVSAPGPQEDPASPPAADEAGDDAPAQTSINAVALDPIEPTPDDGANADDGAAPPNDADPSGDEPPNDPSPDTAPTNDDGAKTSEPTNDGPTTPKVTKSKPPKPPTVKSVLGSVTNRAKRKCGGSKGQVVTLKFIIEGAKARIPDQGSGTTASASAVECVKKELAKATFPDGDFPLTTLRVEF